MKKRICVLALLLCLSIPFAALAAALPETGLTVTGTAQQLGKPANYGSGKVTVRVPDENPAQESVNPLTGESYSGDYRLTLVSIDSHPQALPHWGVSCADLMYEMPIQRDGSTRSLALFLGDYPDSAGPVRSARVPMASLREMWGGTYCFYGYQEGSGKTNVKNWVKQNSTGKKFAYPAYLNGITKNSGWFVRSSDQEHVAPYNVRVDLNQVLSGEAAPATPHPFLFSSEGLDRGENVNGVIVSYKATSPAYISAYQYNQATRQYERYRNGTPYIDGDTGEICTYSNVIVLRTDVSWENGNNARPVIRLHGEGVCEFFQNGKYVRGTWARSCTETANLNSRMVFLDENGEELPMLPGKTFIQIVDNEQPVVVLADEEIFGSVAPQEQRQTVGEAKKKN